MPVVIAAAAAAVLIVFKHFENLKRLAAGAGAKAGAEMKVSILGAGSWGTALAIHLGRAGHDVLLWSRDPSVPAAIGRTGRHPRRFPGALFPPGIRASSELAGGRSRTRDTVVIAVPCASYRPLFESSCPDREHRRFVSTAKGIEPDTLRRMSQIILEYQPAAEVAALSGPTFAEGVARGGSVRGGHRRRRRDRSPGTSRASSRTRTCGSTGRTTCQGVELAGALKNVVAIAAGIVSGLGFGANTVAALVTRGLAEIGRIVQAGGGQARTVAGLAGIGDLMLTCTGKESRNRRVGEAIGRGRRLPDVLLEMPEVAEGARTCLAVPTDGRRAGIEAPDRGRRRVGALRGRPGRGPRSRRLMTQDAAGRVSRGRLGVAVGARRRSCGTRQLLSQRAFFGFSSTRIGSTIACRPANWSRRWMPNAVSLCRSR